MNDALLVELARRASARSVVVVVVGDVKLKLHQVQVLHALVLVDDEWSFERLAKHCSRVYGGSWDKVKVYRAVRSLRLKGFVTSEGLGTVREAVAVVAERQLHDPRTGKLWVEVHARLRTFDDDLGLADVIAQLREAFRR